MYRQTNFIKIHIFEGKFNGNIFTHFFGRNSSTSAIYAKKNWKSVSKVGQAPNIALQHFDSLYSKVYGQAWPSMRLGLLSPKKQSLVSNTFIDHEKNHDYFVNELGAIDLARYYKKHLVMYTRLQLRKQLIENKKARKRELLAKNEGIAPESIDINAIEVSDVSDSELRGAESTDASDDGGFSSAEDLQEMFTDRRVDDDERYFVNRASTTLDLNDFVPVSEFIRSEEVVDELSYYKGYEENSTFDIQFRTEPSLEFSDQLKIYTFPRDEWERFSPPDMVTPAKLFTYYLLDGASLLPVLALDLKMNDMCADYCAAPGGKSLALLMTLKPKYLLSNDISRSRLARLSRVIKQYVPEISYLKSTLNMRNANGKDLIYPNTFDKILVDAPCSNDRVSAENMENNLFKRTRTEERLNLPVTQCDILKAALKSLKPKGCVVYSTCTMSPIENDGVVERALTQLREENFSSEFAIMDLKEAFRPLRGLFKFKTNFRFGQQVVPSVHSNFGPMYISKVKRLK